MARSRSGGQRNKRDASNVNRSNHRRNLWPCSTLIQIIEKFLRERTAQEEMDRSLQRATKQVAFWNSWYKAQQSVRPPEKLAEAKEIVLKELDDLSVAQRLKPAPTAGQAVPDSVVRRLLLAYKPSHAVAWLPRVFFYAFLLYLIVASVRTLFNPKSFSDLTVWLLLFLLVTLVWLFRLLALRLQSGSVSHISTEASTGISRGH